MPCAYAPGFEHDAFISYASVDDTPLLGSQGWVSTFYELLNKRLAQLLGRRDCFSVWLDRTRLDGAVPLPEGIGGPLKKTAVMIALLSNGYLASEWCHRERDIFLTNRGNGDGAPLFVVELDRLEPEQLPREFADRMLYRFWVQGSVEMYPRLLGAPEADYLSRIDALARGLVKVLKRLKGHGAEGEGHPQNESPAAPQVPPPPRPQTTVYLAEATEDLDSLWWKVKGYLEQHQIAVLPSQYLPRDPDAFRQAVVSSLADADLFVQLLSKVPGRRMDEERTYVAFQHTCAREAGLPVLQWRDPVLTEKNLAEVEAATHRELLDGPCVQAVHIEEFKQEILRTLERLRAQKETAKRLAEKKENAGQGKASDKFVFIVADLKDGPVARSIFEYLGQQGYPCGLPISLEDPAGGLTPADIRQDFEDNVRLADGTVIVYGQTPPTWYRSQLSEVRKIQIQYRREDQRYRVGLFLAPPPKEVLMRPPGVYVIPGKEGINAPAFQSFLDALQECVRQEQQA